MTRFERFAKENGLPFKESEWRTKKFHDIVVYAPEHAEGLDDTYTYEEILDLCQEWISENKTFCIKNKHTATDLASDLLDDIEWIHPYTWLEELKHFD